MLKQLNGYDQFIGEHVTLNGRVIDDPVYDDKGQLDFRIGGVVVNGGKLPGQIRVRGFTSDLRRGDTVKIKGKFNSGFGSYQAAMSFASISVGGRSGSWLEATRRRFFAATYSVLPDTHASLGLGFLAGLRSALPDTVDDQLRIVGLTHIVVASGYNLTVLVRLSRRLFGRFSKYQAFASSVALVLGFIAMTGASPSIVRAAVVTLLALSAWYYGRRIHPVLIILLGAALTAGFSPLYIWYDLGWWLSFLAFSGVLILAPLLTRRLFGSRTPRLPMQIAIETIAAQALATPLILFVFGDFSLVAVIANIAVVPAIPIAMALTLICGAAGVVSPIIGAWLAVPAKLVLDYILEMAALMSMPSWAKIDLTISAVSMTGLYVAIIILAIILRRKTGMRFSATPSVIE